MKKIIIALITFMLAFVLLFAPVIVIVTLFSNQDSAEEEEEQLEEEQEVLNSLIERFEITGAKNGTEYILKFQFEDWKIDNVRLNIVNMDGNGKGSVITSVRVPGYTGTNEDIAWQFLRQRGFSPEGAAGLMANIYTESAGTFDPTINEYGNGIGYGLCQWSFGRRDAIEQWLRARGLNPNRNTQKLFLAQLEYAITEPGYGGIVRRMKAASSVDKATYIWCTEWERPANMDYEGRRRAKMGRKYLAKYGSSPVRPGGERDVTLAVKYEIFDNEVVFQGKLDNIDIAGVFDTGTIEGSGEYGEGAQAHRGGAVAQAAIEQVGKHFNSFPGYFHWGAWCGDFTKYCVIEIAGLTKYADGTNLAWADNWQGALKEHGKWHGKSGTASPGDVIVFSGHVGIVEYAEGSQIHTIEGNTSSSSGRSDFTYVERKIRYVSDPWITGWGTP